jgi:hypothetical protein
VAAQNAKDSVTVHIGGLPSYETITDNLDHKTFSGSSVTLTAAEVDSGLTLSSHYVGSGSPTATLTVTATESGSHGASVTSAAQTITVKDPPAGSGSTTASGGSGSGASGSGGSHLPDPGGLFDGHPGFAGVANTLGDFGSSKLGAASDSGASSGSGTSAGAKAFALFNQMMAGDFGGESHFAQAGAAVSAASQLAGTLITRPLH